MLFCNLVVVGTKLEGNEKQQFRHIFPLCEDDSLCLKGKRLPTGKIQSLKVVLNLFTAECRPISKPLSIEVIESI